MPGIAFSQHLARACIDALQHALQLASDPGIGFSEAPSAGPCHPAGPSLSAETSSATRGGPDSSAQAIWALVTGGRSRRIAQQASRGRGGCNCTCADKRAPEEGLPYRPAHLRLRDELADGHLRSPAQHQLRLPQRTLLLRTSATCPPGPRGACEVEQPLRLEGHLSGQNGTAMEEGEIVQSLHQQVEAVEKSMSSQRDGMHMERPRCSHARTYPPLQ